MENETLEIMKRNHAIDENKKRNKINKLKEKNLSMKQMIEGMKAECEEKLESNEIELEKFKITVAETEACIVMLIKDEYKK